MRSVAACAQWLKRVLGKDQSAVNAAFHNLFPEQAAADETVVEVRNCFPSQLPIVLAVCVPRGLGALAGAD